MIEHANLINELSLLNSNGLLICETDNTVNLKDDLSDYELINQKKLWINYSDYL